MERNPIETTEPTGERPVWTAPVVRRIDIRRTLFTAGSNTDGFGGSQVTSP